MDFPRILISALRGGAGKTILSIGITAAWKKLGERIAPFKKGPDYIDAGWLSLAAGRPCHNLDTFLIEKNHVLQSFLTHASKSDIAVVEGNRGLYDGIDMAGSTSTAELAKLLKTPIVLCVDCTKSTRTVAAAVLGCKTFDPNVDIKGVILNRVAGSRHENILRTSIEHYCDIPVLGAVPKLDRQNFPERHMGLIPTPEHSWAHDSIDAASQMAKNYLDLDTLATVAWDAGSLTGANLIRESIQQSATSIKHPKPKIGIIKDSAFQFYYPENIEALKAAGAETLFISPLT
jgi:cobyrinic acid a,c-diamide synthase